MDLTFTVSILVFIMSRVAGVSGQMATPQNLQVDILDGEVIVFWDKPAAAPFSVLYNVQFGSYSGEWTTVNKCTKITKKFCDLSHLITDYVATYKVRVQMEAGGVQSEWTVKKKILPNSSDLQPSSFTMWATSSSLTVQIHQKPILRNLFPFGIIYTIYLVEKEHNKTTVAHLKDDIWHSGNTKVFSSLRRGKEYCVTVKLEGSTGLVSSRSPQHCLVLPEKEWFILAVSSLSVVGVLIVAACVASFILCYVKPPAKTPVALRSAASGWRPLSLVEGTMEVVTDKGWFLSRAAPTTYITAQKSEEDRRPSTDSGVSMKCTPDTTGRDGSTGAREAVCSYPVQDEGRDTISAGESDDSGVGLDRNSDASSLHPDDRDGECLNKSGELHRERLLTVTVHEDVFKEERPETELISVMSGYRINTSICTCSGAKLCIWCCNQDNYRGQCKGLLQNSNTVDSNRHYSPTDETDRTETKFTSVELEETFPMLTSLSSFPLMEKGRDFNMNDVTISLCNVELLHH